MTETIRYTRIGKDDVAFGTGQFEVELADGRRVVMSEVDIGSIIQDPTLSTPFSILPAGASVARPLTERFADHLNVRDYGALGDDLTDDTAAIQATIAKASASSKCVYIPSGVYQVSGVMLPDTMSVIGDGYSSVLKLQDGAKTAVVRNEHWDSIGNSRIVLSNLRIDGNHANNVGSTPQEEDGISFRKVDDVLIDRVWVHNCRVFGIFIGWSQSGVPNPPQGPSRRVTITNSFIFDCGVGEASGVGGIVVTNGQYVLINNCHVRNVFNVGIRLESQNPNIGDQQSYIVVANNTVNADSAGTLIGITVEGRNAPAGTGLVTGTQVVNNTIVGTLNGIRTGNLSGNVVLSNNSIISVTQDGIVLQAGTTGATVTGNTIRAPGRYGISNGAAGDSPNDNVINNNAITSAGREAIYFDRGLRNMIGANLIRDPGQSGTNLYDAISLAPLSVDECFGSIISGNSIRDTTDKMRNGIHVIDTSLVEITGNVIEKARSTAIMLERVRTSLITGNRIHNPGSSSPGSYHGIHLLANLGGDATDNLISNNVIIDTANNIFGGITTQQVAGLTDRNAIMTNIVRGAQVPIYHANGMQDNVGLGNTGSPGTGWTDRLFGSLVLSGTVVTGSSFTAVDGTILYKDPGGATQSLDPAGIFHFGHLIVVIHFGSSGTVVVDSGGGAYSIAAFQRGIFTFDGATWRKVFVG